MGAGLSAYHGNRPRWRVILCIFVGGLIVRALIWGGQRDMLSYELAYQLPLSLIHI